MAASARQKGKASKIFQKLMGPSSKSEKKNKKKRGYVPMVQQPEQPFLA